ncbi:hypothetical protein MMC29_008214, partial [Sticta canariensis]|nr:hypothetical protein [Sticta canariensis]
MGHNDRLSLAGAAAYYGSMEAYISRFAGYHHELVEMDARLPDWVETSWLLGSLDSKFDNGVHTLLVACAVPPTFDAIVTASSEEDDLIKRRAQKPSSMAVRVKSTKSSKGKPKSTTSTTNATEPAR